MALLPSKYTDQIQGHLTVSNFIQRSQHSPTYTLTNKLTKKYQRKVNDVEVISLRVDEIGPVSDVKFRLNKPIFIHFNNDHVGRHNNLD